YIRKFRSRRESPDSRFQHDFHQAPGARGLLPGTETGLDMGERRKSRSARADPRRGYSDQSEIFYWRWKHASWIPFEWRRSANRRPRMQQPFRSVNLLAH